MNRQLRLNLEALRAHDQIERRATALGMRPAVLADTLVLPRLVDDARSGELLARVR